MPLENISSNFPPVTQHTANIPLAENDGHDRNSLNPLHQHMYQSYPVIPYQNQPLYQNVIYHGPINTPVNAVNYTQHIQVIASPVINNNSYLYNNSSEHTHVHYNSDYKVEQNTSQISNNTQVTATIQQNDDCSVHENGECNSSNNAIQEQKDEEKQVIVQKPVSKSWASLFSQKNNQEEHHNNYSETNGKQIEIEDDSSIKVDLESSLKSAEDDSNIKNNYNDPVYYRLGGKYISTV